MAGSCRPPRTKRQALSTARAASTASYTSRRGTPAARATSVSAALRSTPAASRARDHRGEVGGGGRLGVGRAGDDEGDLAAHLAFGRPGGELAQRAGAALPRTSWSARGRAPPAARRRKLRPAQRASRATRRGDSSSTSVRRSVARTASRARRSPGPRGRKPSKTQRSDGRPETASAVVTADGPGHDVNRHSRLGGRPHQPVPRIGDPRHARIRDDGNRAARSACARSAAAPGARSLASK